MRAALSIGQISLSLGLLVGGILLRRTVRNLYAVDAGLSIDGVSTLWLTAPRDLDPAAADAFHRRLLAAVRQIPGVEGAVLDLYGPHGPMMMGRVGQAGLDRDELTRAHMIPVTPGWFELFETRTLAGRTFTPDDWRPGAPARAVLTASLARRLFGREDVVGRRVAAGSGEPTNAEVIGVIDDIRTAFAPDAPHDAFFMTFDHAPGVPFLSLLVKSARPDVAFGDDVRAAVERILPNEPVSDPVPLTERVDGIHSERRIFSNLLELLSALAVLLAAVGLYGMLAFGVASRRREFGVRLALGARTSTIGGLVARSAVAIIATGVIVGLFGAYAFSRVLEHRLFGVAPTDPATYAAAGATLALVGAIACLIPAIAAVRVDPVSTLREE